MRGAKPRGSPLRRLRQRRPLTSVYEYSKPCLRTAIECAVVVRVAPLAPVKFCTVHVCFTL